jgi:hypothetical protein
MLAQIGIRAQRINAQHAPSFGLDEPPSRLIAERNRVYATRCHRYAADADDPVADGEMPPFGAQGREGGSDMDRD